ncbi:hypothetical protein WSK_4327 [Novosphingobium sp. Rr 2-17]|uniref:hypothetical protein n=1 Tax=Novosphingobium sp. Rr 2-17 TaxID=555793 RepID=UPI0002697F22|nr:hypothetical protein [Novosphingobium sp. Rr 2-17]EIZ77121.1 hypothetical protein WSK_4327 [Novosphingobium sp. Rr 2-17]
MEQDIELWVRITNRVNINSVILAYQFVDEPDNFRHLDKVKNKPTFTVPQSRKFRLIWAMKGGLDGTGSMKVELMRGSTVLESRTKSKIPSGVTGAVDWFRELGVD